MQHVMLDLETTGTAPGCAILSIGAVGFDPATGQTDAQWNNENEVEGGFYKVVSRADQRCYSALHENEETIKWWARQDPVARKVLQEPVGGPFDELENELEAMRAAGAALGALMLVDALEELNSFLGQYRAVKVWGNGADFDNAILAALYHATGVKQGWGAWNGRCYRTFKAQTPEIKLQRRGTYHNAVADAMCQAEHALEICRFRRINELG